MGKVKYTGPDDARILDAKDIAKAIEDANFRKTTFVKGEVVEIDDAVIEAIVAVPEIFGNFEAVNEAEAKAEAEKPAKGKAKADEGAVTETSSASTSDAPASRPTGKASTSS